MDPLATLKLAALPSKGTAQTSAQGTTQGTTQGATQGTIPGSAQGSTARAGTQPGREGESESTDLAFGGGQAGSQESAGDHPRFSLDQAETPAPDQDTQRFGAPGTAGPGTTFAHSTLPGTVPPGTAVSGTGAPSIAIPGAAGHEAAARAEAGATPLPATGPSLTGLPGQLPGTVPPATQAQTAAQTAAGPVATGPTSGSITSGAATLPVSEDATRTPTSGTQVPAQSAATPVAAPAPAQSTAQGAAASVVAERTAAQASAHTAQAAQPSPTTATELQAQVVRRPADPTSQPTRTDGAQTALARPGLRDGGALSATTLGTASEAVPGQAAAATPSLQPVTADAHRAVQAGRPAPDAVVAAGQATPPQAPLGEQVPLDLPAPEQPLAATASDASERGSSRISGDGALGAGMLGGAATGGTAASATNTTAAAPAVSLPGTAEAARVIAPQVAQAIAGRVAGEQIEIRLKPPELGRLDIVLELGDQGLRAVVSAERSATGDLIRRHAEILLQEFAEAGFADVDLRFADHSAGGGGEQRQGSSFAGEAQAQAWSEVAETAVHVHLPSSDGLDLRF